MNIIKDIYQLHLKGILLQDILSVIYDLRPCIRYGLDKEKYFLLKELLPKFKLNMIIYNYKCLNKPVCIIGKNKSINKKAYLSDKNGEQDKLGYYLGYPSCCIKEWEDNKSINKETIPIITKKKSTSLSYKLNYLFNLDSRANNLNPIEKLSQNNYSSYNKYFIPHIPCSFDCKDSLNYANKLYNIIKSLSPEYLKELEYNLKNTFLFIDNFRFIGFKGVVNNNKLLYTSVLDYNTLLDKEILNSLLKGNKLLIDNKNLLIYNNQTIINKFNTKCELLDFTN
jgi:hypothetical protein